jgi:hypothetical protein
MNELRNWTGNRRSDGAVIAPRGAGDGFVAVGPKVLWTMVSCPCCGLIFETEEAAKLTADRVHPVPVPGVDADRVFPA